MFTEKDSIVIAFSEYYEIFQSDLLTEHLHASALASSVLLLDLLILVYLRKDLELRKVLTLVLVLYCS